MWAENKGMWGWWCLWWRGHRDSENSYSTGSYECRVAHSETESKLCDPNTCQAFALTDLPRTECSLGESPEISSISDNPFWALFYPISHNRTPTMEETIEDPPTSAVLLDHCHFSQVIFNSVEKFYVPGGDITCYYTLTQHFIPRRKDWIGIFRVSG